MKEIYKDCIGKVCLVRSYDAGVYYGTVTDIEGETVRVENVRNIWRWRGANCLSDIADHGVGDKAYTRISINVGSIVLNRVCQIISMTDAAINNLNDIPSWTI